MKLIDDILLALSRLADKFDLDAKVTSDPAKAAERSANANGVRQAADVVKEIAKKEGIDTP